MELTTIAYDDLANTSSVWLITQEFINQAADRRRDFIATVDSRISPEHMIQIVRDIVVEIADHNSVTPPKETPTFMYLNDGSLFRDHIVNTSGVLIHARRAYNLSVVTDATETRNINWSEPHIIVENGERHIAFWESLNISIPHNISKSSQMI